MSKTEPAATHQEHFGERQRASLARLRAAVEEAEQQADQPNRTRDQSVLASRCVDALRAAQAAAEHSELPWTGSDDDRSVSRAAVLVTAHAGFQRILQRHLQDAGVAVIGCTASGPVALGWAVRAQPEVVVVHEPVMTFTGEQLTRELRRFCEHTVIAVVAQSANSVGLLLDAGATVVSASPSRIEELVADIASTRR
jgi:hypothetical protein